MSQINFDKLSLEEVEQIEELTGKNLDELLVANRAPSAKTIRAFGLVVLRRTNPGATWEEMGSMSYVQVIELISGPDEAASTPKAGGPTKRAPSSKRR